MPYQVEFENDPNATAPAQIVTITDQLSSHLDWTTFELTEITFGEHIISVPAKTQHFEWTEPMHYNGLDFEVQIEAGIHLATGEVYAYFYSIDPSIGLPPGVDYGFLPPEDGNGIGQGYFSFVVRSKNDLTDGTRIYNIAHITFDFQETIATNLIDPHDPSQGTDPNAEAFNIIDAEVPTSYVLPLPNSIASPFTLEWAGDDKGGSGIACYDIYVSKDGADYYLWGYFTELNVIFYGELGHTYAFYSVAIDNVGHREQPPEEADAITTITSVEPVDVSNMVNVTDSALRYDRRMGQSSMDIMVTNISENQIVNPLSLVIDSITPSEVTMLVDPNDVPYDDKPSVDLSALLGDNVLSPGECITKRLFFDNTDRLRFRAELSVYGVPESPAGTSGMTFGIGDLPRSNINGIGLVDMADFALLAEQWLRSECHEDNSWCAGADVNQDKTVDIQDIVIMAGDWLE
jgi:hypothetical protein